MRPDFRRAGTVAGAVPACQRGGVPELPDIELYLDRLRPRVVGSELRHVRLVRPFVLRTVRPPIERAHGRVCRGVRRIGKRIALQLEGDLTLVSHLMIAGRLRWRKPGAKAPARIGSAVFEFAGGSLLLTEAGSKKRASLHLVEGAAAIEALDPGGLEVLEADLPAFLEALRRENRTLKRALTDPRLFSGIGNAYSDEILHAARLSPVTWTSRLPDDAAARLFEAAREVLGGWTRRLREEEPADRFPEKVTAFREGMAVHGRFRLPCPDCGAPVQRIRYADNESNYCPGCQTGGKVLADRSLSRLLGKDWPRRLEDLENTPMGRPPDPR